MWNYVGLTLNTSRLKAAHAMFLELSEIEKFIRMPHLPML
jgi:hypothetical protein